MKLNKFIKYSLKSPKEVGTLFPTSKFVSKQMVKNIDFEKSKILVEIGSGTGAITKTILKNMSSDSKLFCFEVNKDFFNTLNQLKDDRLITINDSAEDLNKYLKKYNAMKVDYIISSIPLTTLNKRTVEAILDNIVQIINSYGVFIQLQYSLFSIKKIKKYFSNVSITFTPLNYFPSFIYTCHNFKYVNS